MDFQYISKKSKRLNFKYINEYNKTLKVVFFLFGLFNSILNAIRI